MPRTRNDEWCTPPEVIKLAERCMRGKIGLDPCSSGPAAGIVDAERNWFPADDGLKKPWKADRVWMNPPFSRPLPWAEMMFACLTTGEVRQACVLLADRALTTKAGVCMLTAAKILAIPEGRIRFWLNGRPGPSPSFGAVMFLGGEDLDEKHAVKVLREVNWTPCRLPRVLV